MSSSSSWTVALFVAVMAGSSGCKSAKAGDACAGSNANVCTGLDTALVCVSGSLVALACKPDGCTKSPFACDFRDSPTGSVCFEPSAPSAPMSCTPDKKARARCLKGKVERDACDGPRGCFPKSDTSMGCDRALRAGNACSIDGDWCSEDKSEWLQCRDGKLVVVAKCRGPNRCMPFDETIACDTVIGEAGDPCIGKAEACAADKKSTLACVNGKLAVQTTCPSGKLCDASGQVTCK